MLLWSSSQNILLTDNILFCESTYSYTIFRDLEKLLVLYTGYILGILAAKAEINAALRHLKSL